MLEGCLNQTIFKDLQIICLELNQDFINGYAMISKLLNPESCSYIFKFLHEYPMESWRFIF